jgi:PKD repeat protein
MGTPTSVEPPGSTARTCLRNYPYRWFYLLFCLSVAAGTTASARNRLGPPPGGAGGGGEALPTSQADHNVNQVQTTLTDVGAIGYFDPVNQVVAGSGFIFQGLPSALFHGGLVLGDSPLRVSDAAYGSDDQGVTRPFNFVSTSPITVGNQPAIDQFTCATFEDLDFDQAPLGVSVGQATYAWSGDSYAILEYTITASVPLAGLFVGLYTDWDVGTFDQNQVQYDFPRQLGIMSSLAGDPNFYGIQLLSHPASGYRAIDNAIWVYGSGSDPGFEDQDKFQFMNGFSVVQSDRPADWSNMIAAGPISLVADESVRVAFAMLAGPSIPALGLAADQARTRWANGIENPCLVTNQLPVCDAGGPYSGILGQAVVFDGSGSFDPDGTIVSYRYDFGDGVTITGPLPTQSHTYAETGLYTVELMVTDNQNGSSTCTTTASLPPVPGCEYAPAGTDGFDTTAELQIDVPSLGEPLTLRLSGPATFAHGPPIDQGGLVTIQTELLSLELTGVSCLGPVGVHLNPLFPALGVVQQQDPSSCFPLPSSINAFLIIELPGLTLHNPQPILLNAAVTAIPPYGDPHLSAGPVTLHDPQNAPVGTLEQAIYTPQFAFDYMTSTAEIDVELFGGPLETVFLDGPVLVRRGAPLKVVYPQAPVWEIQTEMVSLDLRGVHPTIGPIVVNLRPDQIAEGAIVQDFYNGFPAHSFFQVPFQIRAELNPDVLIRSSIPSRMSATIPNVPPIGTTYANEYPVPVENGKPPHTPTGTVPRKRHTPTGSIPYRPYPPIGTDGYCAGCQLRLQIGSGQPILVSGLNAEWRMERGDPILQDAGVSTIATNTTRFIASGFSPELGGDVFVMLDTTGPASTGQFRQLQRGPQYPAESTCDLLLDFQIPGQGFMGNAEPFRIQSVVNSIPFSEPHQGAQPVTLFNPSGQPVGTLLGIEVFPQVPFAADCDVSPPCGVITVDVPDEQAPQMQLRLHPSVPNPFANSSAVVFDLPLASTVEVEIVAVTGRTVRTITAPLAAGRQQIRWDGRDEDGQLQPSGVYLYTVRTAAGSATGRCLLVR